MFSNFNKALEYYHENLVQEIESEYYDSEAINILGNFHSHPGIDWWEDNIKNINDAIFQARQQLGYMWKDAKHIESDDYDDVMKEQYDNKDDDDFYKRYPTYKDWEDTEDFYEEIEFIQEVEWKDFKKNYENELEYIKGFRDIRDLMDQISNIEDELSNIPEKLLQLKDGAMHETIKSCFEGIIW